MRSSTRRAPFVGQCDVVRRRCGGEDAWQEMMATARRIPFSALLAAVDTRPILDEGESPAEWIENAVRSDPSTYAAEARVAGKRVYFLATSGFEFIFTKDGGVFTRGRSSGSGRRSGRSSGRSSGRELRLARMLQTDEKIDMTLYDVRRGRVSFSSARPIEVKALPDGTFYVIDGAHRVVEALLAGKPQLPARIVPYPYPIPTRLRTFRSRLSEPGAWAFGDRRQMHW